MKIPAGNIYSGDRLRAVFTNPTELAYKKGNLKHHYPIEYKGVRYADVEEAYQLTKKNSHWMKFGELMDLMIDLIEIKLRTYPRIVQAIDESGGDEWIASCSHFSGAKTAGFKRWEGKGLDSPFINCLYAAYRRVKEKP